MTAKIIMLLLLATLSASGGEPVDSLKKVDAPAEEFVRIPASYILQKLERSAVRSGNVALSGFTVRNDRPEINDKRLTLNGAHLNDAGYQLFSQLVVIHELLQHPQHCVHHRP